MAQYLGLKYFFTKLLLPPQKFAALGGRLVRLVVKPALDLFSFMNSREQTAIGSPVSKEVDDYLASKAMNIQSLKDFPTIARAFQKANSTLPSSAAVERLFSVSGMILTPRRCRMSDKLFDMMVFLKGC